MPSFFRAIVASIACLSLNSCIAAATYGIGTVERSLAVGENFAAWKTQMPAIPPGMGRLIVYPGGGRSVVFETTSIGKGGEQDFVVDSDVCTVLGHSFIYVDRPAGPHEISADDVSKAFGYQKGRHKLEVTLAPSTVIYISIDKVDNGALSRSHYFPHRVPAETAEAKLKAFPIDTDGLKCRLNKAEPRKKK